MLLCGLTLTNQTQNIFYQLCVTNTFSHRMLLQKRTIIKWFSRWTHQFDLYDKRKKNTEVKQQANKKINKNVAKQITYNPAIHLPLQLWQN